MAQTMRTSTVEKAILDAVKFATSRMYQDPKHVTGELGSLLQISSVLNLDCSETVREAWSEAFRLVPILQQDGFQSYLLHLSLSEAVTQYLDQQAEHQKISRGQYLSMRLSQLQESWRPHIPDVDLLRETNDVQVTITIPDYAVSVIRQISIELEMTRDRLASLVLFEEFFRNTRTTP